MKALVTGSSGFIGSHLVRQLRLLGHDVVEADLKLGTDLSRPSEAQSCYYAKPEIIFHLASSCSTPGSIERPLETFNDTVRTAVNVLDVARRLKVPVILTSSVKARDGETPYGAAKCMVEIWAREYRRLYGVPLVINRPGTVYGPGQEGSDESGWIAWFTKARAEGIEVVINGDGNQVRDLLHVSDYVRLMITQARHLDRYDGRTFDVGGGDENAVTVNQIVKHLGLKYTHGPARYGDAREYIGYNDVPGWKPEIRWWESETLR